MFGLKVALSLFVFFFAIDVIAIIVPQVAVIKAIVMSPLAGIQSLTGIDLTTFIPKPKQS